MSSIKKNNTKVSVDSDFPLKPSSKWFWMTPPGSWPPQYSSGFPDMPRVTGTSITMPDRWTNLSLVGGGYMYIHTLYIPWPKHISWRQGN